MYRILTVFLFLSSFLAKGQTHTSVDQGATLYKYKNGLKVDSALFLPRKDTVTADLTMRAPGMLVYRPQDSLLYYRKGDAMTPVSTGGGDLSNYYTKSQSDTRFVHYTDTSLMLVPYLRKSDTSSMLSSYLRKTDTAGMLNNYYTKTELQTAGQAAVHWGNLTNITDAEANGEVKGIATFNGNDFNDDGSGAISLDTVNWPAYTKTQSDVRFVHYTDTTAMLSNYFRNIHSITGPNLAFATGTSGTDFNIGAAGSTITLNIPDASPTSRGAMTNGFQQFAGSKVFQNGLTVQNMPAMGSIASLFVVSNSSVLNTRTGSQVLSDIGGAPSTGGTGYIWNGTSAQTADFNITGGGRLGGGLGVGTTIAPTTAKIYSVSTTLPQLRTEYSTGNRMDVTTGSTGSTTFNLSGTSPIFTFNQGLYAPQLNANIPYVNATTTEVYVASNSVKDPTVRVFTFQNGNEAGLDTTGTIAFTRSNNNSISLTDPSNGYGYVLAGQSIGQLVGDGVLRDESISFGAVTTGNPYVKIGFYSESDWLNVASAQTSIRFATKGNATTLPTERMRITQDGRVGIGTTLPFAPLHAHGTNPLALTGLQAGASTDSILTIAAGIVRKIPFANGGTGFWSVTGNSGTVASTNFIGTTDNVDLRFRTNNTDKVTITTGGNLGINSTGPTRKLVINDANTTAYTPTGAVSMPDGLFQSVNNTANTNTTLAGITFQSTNSSGNFQSGFIGVVSNSGAGIFAPEMVFGQRTGSATYAERMRITSAGAVGINETAPGAELDVKGTSAVTGAALRVRNSTPSTVFQVDNAGDVTLFNGVKLVTGSGSPEGVVTAPTGSMYLNTAGGTITTLYIKTSGAGSTGWTAK